MNIKEKTNWNAGKQKLKRRKKKIETQEKKIRTQEKIIQTPKNKIKKLEKIIIAQIMMLALRSSVNKILGAIIIFSSFLILFFGVWIIFSCVRIFFSCVSIFFFLRFNFCFPAFQFFFSLMFKFCFPLFLQPDTPQEGRREPFFKNRSKKLSPHQPHQLPPWLYFNFTVIN